MKKYVAALISLTMIIGTLPSPAVMAEGATDLISNGSFESYDAKSEFPVGWSSAGENLLLEGNFENGSSATSNIGKSPTGYALKWVSPSTSANSVEVVSSSSGEKAEHGNYYAKLQFKSSNWGGIGYNNAAKPDYLFNTAYGGSYIFRADYRVSSTAAFNKASMCAFYIATVADSEVANQTKFETSYTDTVSLPKTSWQSFEKELTLPEKPTGSETYYDIPHVLRFQFRYGAKPVLSTGATADLFVDNIRLEKLGRTTSEKSYQGDRSLKYVGYDDNLNEDWVSDEISLKSGGLYELTYYSVGVGASAYIEDSDGNKPKLETVATETDGEWTKTTLRFTANGSAKVGLTGGLNTVYFDSISLKETLVPKSISITAETGKAYANRGAQTALTAQIYDQFGSLMSGESVAWSIKETDADAQITTGGLLTVGDGAALGSYITVVATSASDSSVYGEARLLVCGVESMPVKVTISGKQSIATVTGGAYTQEAYTATVCDQYDAVISDGVDWTWNVDAQKSTVKNITVDNSGVVKVNSNPTAGMLVITASATYGGVSVASEFKITVTQSVEGILFEQRGVSVEPGGERSIAVKVYPDNAQNKAFTVKSSDEAVFEARVEGSNVIVKSVADGQAVITVKSDDGGFESEITAITAKSVSSDVDLTFENGGTGWNLNKFNIIPNADFEGRTDWTAVGPASRADMGYITKDDGAEYVYDGTSSIYMKYGASVGSNIWSAFRNNDVISINPQSTYRLGMAVNIPDIESGQRVALSFKITDSNNNQIVGEDPDILRITVPTSAWEYKETEYTIPENGTKISLLAARGFAKAGFKAYFDNLRFETVAGVTSDQYYAGGHSMRIGAYDGVHSEDCQTVISDNIAVEAGKAYSVSAMLRGDTEEVTGAVVMEYLSAGGDVVKTIGSSPKTCTDWTSVSTSGTAASGCKYMRIKLMSGGTGICYFDNVSVIEEAVYPNSISITGADTVAIPKSGKKTNSYTISVLDQYGEVMADRTAVAELKSQAQGTAFAANVLDVGYDANPTEITVVARLGNLSAEKVISLIKVTSFEFKDLPDSIERGNATVSYDLKTVLGVSNVKNELDNDRVEYSVVENYDGVSVSDGKLVIAPSSKLGTVKVKAVLVDNDDVKAEHSLTIKKAASTSGSGGSGSGGGSSSGSSGGSSGVKYIEGSLGMPGTVDAPTGGAKTQAGTAIKDVPQSHWAYTAVNTFAQNGIVSGRGDGTFDPNGLVTRSEFLKILISVFRLELSYELVNFTDTVETQWYYPYVSSAFANGITSGYPDGTFGINKPVTREEMAVFTKRALEVKGKKVDSSPSSDGGFADADKVSDFAREAVELMRKSGFLSGNDKGMFNPKNNATRAETAMMLYRVYSVLY